ncbi:MAG: ThuA domain-containing protein [Verrucomicrobiales bacterium]|nr:ThuA domain-containing protein [Verrucomicrobiales bacterium]
MNAFRLFLLFVTSLVVIGSITLIAQDKKGQKKPQTWAEKKAAKFAGKPTADEKEKILAALPDKATKKPSKVHKILMIDRCEGFIHSSIPHGNFAMEELGKKVDTFNTTLVGTYDPFTKENLKQYDAILFNNTTHLNPSEEQREAILDFVKGGKGIIGLHAAGDNFGKWPEGVALIGGVFNGHPWNAGGTWAFKLDDPNHPLNAAFKKEGFWHANEIYWYKPESFQGRDKLRVLLSLDMTKPANQKAIKPKDKEKAGTSPDKVDVPVSWIQEIGEGRVFYTNLGHREDTFWNSAVLLHISDGIQYALGDLEADATPSAKAGALKPILAPEKSE